MDDDLYIIPAPADEGYVPLSRTKQGKLYKKHLLTKGKLYHPKSGTPIEIDDAFLNTIKRNFDDKVCDIVQVPLANERNEHSENPLDNLGEVVDVEVTDGKLYAYVDIRDPRAKDMMGKTLLGASAMLAMDYVDTRTNLPKGPTLLHSCVTNRPYVLELGDYEEVVAASSDMKGEAVLLSATATAEPVVESAPEPEKEKATMTLEELLAELKTEHAIDVSALQTRVTELETATSTLETEKATLSNERDEAVKLSNDLTEALGASGVVSLSNGGEITPADVIGAVSELAQGHITLSNQVKVLASKDADHEVQDLVDEGKVYAAQKKWLVDLKLSNPTAYEGFISTLPDTPAIPVEKEVGNTVPEGDAHNRHVEEIARLTAPGGPAYQYINRSGS